LGPSSPNHMFPTERCYKRNIFNSLQQVRKENTDPHSTQTCSFAYSTWNNCQHIITYRTRFHSLTTQIRKHSCPMKMAYCETESSATLKSDPLFNLATILLNSEQDSSFGTVTRLRTWPVRLPVSRKYFLFATVQTESRDGVVGIATGYWLDDWWVGARVPIGSRIFSSPSRPDRLWGPSNLLYNGYRGLFPRG
jgi:hypothetical protein